MCLICVWETSTCRLSNLKWPRHSTLKRVLCGGHEDVLCVVGLSVPTCVWEPGTCRFSNVKWPLHSTLQRVLCSGHEDVVCVVCVVGFDVPTCVWEPGTCRLSNVKWPPHSTLLREYYVVAMRMWYVLYVLMFLHMSKMPVHVDSPTWNGHHTALC